MLTAKPTPPDPGSAGSRALGLGSQLAAGMVFFAGLGYYADRKRGGGTLFTLCGMFAGLGYGVYEVWKLVRQMNNEAKIEGKEGTP